MLADRIMEEYEQAKQEPVKGFDVAYGAEMLMGTIEPNKTTKEE